MWPGIDRYLCNVTVFWKIMFFLVYEYYMHPSYRTATVGKNCAYYIGIFTVFGIRQNGA